MKTSAWLATGLFAGLIALLVAGCGGSSPTDPEEDRFSGRTGEVVLNVRVKASTTRVNPGEFVDLTATVDAVRAEALRFTWVNVTNNGRLLGDQTGVITGPFQIRWQAPENPDPGTVKVEVIQLVVTAISQVISVTDRGIQTTHEVSTETRTIPITIVSGF